MNYKIKALNEAILRGEEARHVLFDIPDRVTDDSFMHSCLLAASEHSEFKQSFDPFGEHEGGKLVVDGEAVYFRIIHYDRSMRRRARLPIDEHEVLSVLLFYR